MKSTQSSSGEKYCGTCAATFRCAPINGMEKSVLDQEGGWSAAASRLMAAMPGWTLKSIVYDRGGILLAQNKDQATSLVETDRISSKLS